MQEIKFIMFTHRTNDPKLGWIEHKLGQAGITHRRNGVSAHAPILEVDMTRIDDAWMILTPVDELPDDNEIFTQPPDG